MSEVVVFPDVVEAYVDYLRDELDDRAWTLTVGTVIPEAGPGTLVRVLRTGGTHHNDPAVPVEQAILTVEAFDPSKATAHDLAQICRSLVLASVGVVDNVRRVDEVAGPGYLPDDFSDRSFRDIYSYPRYTFTVAVTWRGTRESGS